MTVAELEISPLYLWRCRANGDLSSPAWIRSALGPSNDLVKGDGADSDTYPTFVSKNVSTGTPSHYVFDGVDDYVSNWPTMPDEYTVCAAVDTGTGPQLWASKDSTIEDALTVSGAWSGKLYRLAIFDSEISDEEYDSAEYWWVHHVPRGDAKGVDHRMILEGKTAVAMYFYGSTPFDDQSVNGFDGTDTDVDTDTEIGATFTAETANVTVSDFEVSGTSFSCFFEVEQDLSSEQVQTVFHWGSISLTLSRSGSDLVMSLNGSSAIVPEGNNYAITLEDGEEPEFYLDGEWVATGSATLSVPSTNDLIIGNF